MSTTFAGWCGSLKDISKLLGIRSHRIAHAVASGLVEEPRLKIGNHRIFQQEDLIRLAQHFDVTLKDGQAAAAGNAE